MLMFKMCSHFSDISNILASVTDVCAHVSDVCSHVSDVSQYPGWRGQIGRSVAFNPTDGHTSHA